MIRWLTWLLGRLPLGWLQLTHNRGRLFGALTGVAFANVLVFMQLGFQGALTEATVRVYSQLDADILVSSNDFKTLSDSSLLPRERRLRLTAAPGVVGIAAFYEGKQSLTRPDGQVVSFTIYGIEPGRRNLLGVEEIRDDLRLLDTAAIDGLTRNMEAAQMEQARQGALKFEVGGRTLSVLDTFELGAGFGSDGTLIVSDQTFFQLFPNRSAAAPNHILVQVDPTYAKAEVARSLQALFQSSDRVLVRTVDAAREADVTYQNTQRPTGIVFGFGVVIGVLVGIVIVYQVLATDVADHLAEYATLKAMGFPQRYFLGVVFEQSVVLAILGFTPGLVSSLFLYRLVSAATGLQVLMNPSRVGWVFVGTLLMCGFSGAVATRRLAGADPADLF